MADLGAIDEAKALLRASGYVVLREASHRHAQRERLITQARADWEIQRAQSVERWALDCLHEERRLRDRLTFVYGVAVAHGATLDDLRGD